MELRQMDIARLNGFLEKVREEIYSEPPSQTHSEITGRMFQFFMDKYPLPQESTILDVGCGQGTALDLFAREGYHPIGITMDSEDRAVCQRKGFTVYEMDQSFLDFDKESFDLVWCRHCLEHSIFPYFTISEFFRILKPKGYLYVEVPAPETSCRHEGNKNHYSILGKRMWVELLRRSAFRVLDCVDINHVVPAGPDLYYAFIQQKS